MVARCGICSSHPWDSPSALRAPSQPFGCPKLFLTLRRQDAGANIANGDGPQGGGRDARSQPEGSAAPLSPPDTQKAPFGAPSSSRLVVTCRGICSSHPWDSPSALRAAGQPFGCPKWFQTILSNIGSVHQSLSARYAKSPFRGSLRIWRRERDSNPR